MRTLIPRLRGWIARGESIAIARVLETWGSAPRRPGSWMVVSSSGEIAGSVSGGCVEGAVRDIALEVLDGGGARLVEFGVDNSVAWSVGLSCGGKLLIAVQPFSLDVASELLERIEQGRSVTWFSRILDGRPSDKLERTSDPCVSGIDHEDRGEELVISQTFSKPDRLLIIGGAEIAIHLVDMATHAGFETILVDPRAVFTDENRFLVAPDQVYTEWPQEVLPNLLPDANTYAVLLTHDPKIDDPAIKILLRSEVRYIGALGGSRTHAKRKQRLAENGYTEKDIARIRGPVGLKIGAATPAEIAISILAEVIQVRNSRIQKK